MKLAAAVICSLACVAVAQDAAPIDPQTILRELQELQTKQQTSANTAQKRNLDIVLKGSVSKEAAIAFYEDAQMATQFQGANRENSQFRDWKERQADQLKNTDFRESVRLHLFYLGLSLKKAADAKPEELLPQVTDYLRVLDNAASAMEMKESLLKISVADGIFSKWLGLGPELSKAKDWEMSPGKADQIAAKFLLPLWRKGKSPALLGYWDGKIAKESMAAGTAKLDFEERNFASVRKPDLLWQRAQEYLVLEQPNRAISEMFALIKVYPNHPNVTQWIDTLRKTLSPAATPVAP